jgi:hypothetical protein
MRYLAVLLLVVSCALAWEFVPIQVTVWDGGFDVTVRVASAQPLRSVSCQVFGRRAEAEEGLEHLLPEKGLWAAAADPFAGEPLTIHVPVGGRDSPSGRELSRFQSQYLVVVGQLPDGKRIGKLVEIPDCRVSRQVSVSLP